MKYDSFLKYLTYNVKPGKGLSEPKFDSDTCYLVFWASWCGPCIQQIKAMDPEDYTKNNTYFISVDSDVANGISRAEKLGIQNRLFFMDPEVLEILGYKTIPLHLVLIKNERKVLEE
jgi:thiol-disulfide isomerase/thioredoxin